MNDWKTLIPKYGFYLVAGLLVVYLFVSIAIPAATMNVFGFRTFVVVSPSMEPDIMVYDMIVVRRPDVEELEAGDAITFFVHIPELNEKSYVTHYIGEITENESGQRIYKTIDASGDPEDPDDYDEWTDASGNPVDITDEDIEGVLWFVIPRLGFLVAMLRDPLFLGLLVINGTVLYFLFKQLGKALGKSNTNKKETD
jgi:signal peptidase I